MLLRDPWYCTGHQLKPVLLITCLQRYTLPTKELRKFFRSNSILINRILVFLSQPQNIMVLSSFPQIQNKENNRFWILSGYSLPAFTSNQLSNCLKSFTQSCTLLFDHLISKVNIILQNAAFSYLSSKCVKSSYEVPFHL